MTIASSVLFALAALAAILTIWKSVAAALPAIRNLKLQLGEENQAIHVAALNPRTLQNDARPARRQRRQPRQAKRMTHRLHQYPHHACAA